jgi:ABC-type dipeptide/oligopeptide/nickel transport system ATPase component
MLVARAFSHRIAVMYRGRIVEEGPTAQVIAAPRDPYTQRLLAAVQSLDDPEPPAPAAPRPQRPAPEPTPTPPEGQSLC